MQVKRFYLSIIGFSIALFLLDFPISGFITTSRVGFLLFSFGLIGYFSLNKAIKKIDETFQPILLTLSIINVLVFFSTLYNSTSLESFVSWFFVLILISLFSRIRDINDYSIIINAAAICAAVWVFLMFINGVTSFGLNAYTSTSLRHYIDQLGPGLSRIVNGVVFANIILLISFEVHKTRRKFLLLLVSTMMSYWFVLSVHSRQGLLLMSLVFISMMLSIYPTLRYKKLGLAVIMAVLVFILSNVLKSTVFQESFLERTVSQLESGQGSTADRLYFYEVGLQLLDSNLFLGVGPGGFAKIIGRDAHSGYLRLATETGVFAIFIIAYLIISAIITGVKKFLSRREYSFVIIVSIIFLAPLFNSLFDSPMFWSVLALSYMMNKIKLDLDPYSSRYRLRG